MTVWACDFGTLLTVIHRHIAFALVVPCAVVGVVVPEVGQNVPATRATVPAVTGSMYPSVLSSYAIVPAVGAMAPAGTRMHPVGLDAPEPPEPVLGIPGHELS